MHLRACIATAAALFLTTISIASADTGGWWQNDLQFFCSPYTAAWATPFVADLSGGNGNASYRSTIAHGTVSFDIFKGALHSATLLDGHFQNTNGLGAFTYSDCSLFSNGDRGFVLMYPANSYAAMRSWAQSGSGAAPNPSYAIVEFSVAPRAASSTIANLTQYREFGVDPIAPGAGFIGNAVVLKADVADADSASVRLEVEVKPAGTPFDGTNLYATSTPTTTPPIATTTLAVTVSDLIHPSGAIPPEGIEQSFHWRARAVDSEGNASDWVSFGASPDSIDFTAAYTLGMAASKLVTEVVRDPYLWGGKGWDVADKLYVGSGLIGGGYHFSSRTSLSAGLDCSGLLVWAYNKTVDPTKPFNANYLSDLTANDQYENRIPISESELQPGDQLFFDWGGDGRVDHVAMYVGGDPAGDVIHAPAPGQDIIIASKNIYKHLTGFIGFGRPQHTPIAMAVTAHSPVQLSVTDPSGVSISADTRIPSDEEDIREAGDLRYATLGLDTADYPETIVYSHTLKSGAYRIAVSPIAGAAPDQAYSLDFTAGSTTIELARDVPLSRIPSHGYGVVVGADGSATLDATPPEAHIGFSTSTKSILTTGSDDLSATTVSTNATSTLISDAAGNTLTLAIAQDATKRNGAALVMPSFSYSTGTTTAATTSLRYVWRTDRAGTFTTLVSSIRTPTERVIAVYVGALNKTFIITPNAHDDDNADLVEQATRLISRKTLNTYSGMVVPHISTDKGRVVIEY